MQKSLISILAGILILVSSTSIARDKQPRRFDVEGTEVSTSQAQSAPNTSRSNMSVDDRLARLERLINSQGLVDLLLKLEALQKEVQQLRGDIETQAYLAKDLKKRQRDLYIDIDRRMLQLERTGTGGAVSSPQSNQYNNRTSTVAPANTPLGNAVAMPSPSPNSVDSSRSNDKGVSNQTAYTKTSPVSPKTTKKPVDPIKEQNAYQKAFDLLREQRYELAIKAYRQFIKDYPHGRYAHIAQYWLSEASYAQSHFKQAITDYQNLVNNYPNSPKLAEALLKIGYSYNELGQNNAAKDTIEKLLRLYPNTTAAGQGQNLLKKIKSSKR